MKFGIKIGSLKQNLAFAETIAMLTKYYPSLVVEGLNTDFRPRKLEVAKHSIAFGITGIEFSEKKRDLIVIGGSNEYDITFESSKDYSIFGGLYHTIKILNLKKDANLIMKLIADYVTKTYPVTSAINTLTGFSTPRTNSIVKKSSYVLVNGNPISYAEYNAFYC